MNVASANTVILDYIESAHPKPDAVRTTATAYPPGERQRVARLDDAQLVANTVEGHGLAFDELVVRYREKVLRLISSTLGADADAEDIAQDVFVKVYLSLGRFRGDSSFSTYLYTVTINRCRDALRRGKLRKFFSFDDLFARNGISHPAQDGHRDIEGAERCQAVRRAMRRLPTTTQMLLHLREIEELSYKELAEIFEVEIGTIKSRLARGRDKLREELAPYIREGTMPGAK